MLHKATVFNDFDDETLESLRSDWAHADFYRRYVHGSAEDNGEKIAHNPAAMHEYLNHAIELLDGILAAL